MSQETFQFCLTMPSFLLSRAFKSIVQAGKKIKSSNVLSKPLHWLCVDGYWHFDNHHYYRFNESKS